jgi:arsenate reductase-like glutaredoxin family protein
LDELQGGLLGDDPSELFSWRSPSFKKLGLEKSNMTASEILDLMIAEPRLIKRPIIMYQGKRFVTSEWKKILRSDQI